MCNMVSLCGQAVCSGAYKTVGKTAFYAHNPQQNSVFSFLKSYTQFCARTCALTYTHICAQFTSVNLRLYALYTPPTITTTLNN